MTREDADGLVYMLIRLIQQIKREDWVSPDVQQIADELAKRITLLMNHP